MKTNDEYGQFIKPTEVRLVRLLPGPVERLWEYLVDDEKRSRWFAGGPLERKVGGKLTLIKNDAKLAGSETPPPEFQQSSCGESMPGVVTRYEPPRVLAYIFGQSGQSQVTFELIPQGDQVQLVLTHRSGGSDTPLLNNFAAGWHTFLDHLTATLTGAPRPPLWALHSKYRSDYEKLRGTSQPIS